MPRVDAGITAKTIQDRIKGLPESTTQAEAEAAIQAIFDADEVKTPADVKAVRKERMKLVELAQTSATVPVGACCFNDGSGMQCVVETESQCLSRPNAVFWPEETCSTHAALAAKGLVPTGIYD